MSKAPNQSKPTKTPNAKPPENNPNQSQSQSLNQSQSKQNSMIESQRKPNENNPLASSQQSNQQPVYPVRPYLERNLVPIVQQGLIELDKARPDDPLEFLGNYLIAKAQSNK